MTVQKDVRLTFHGRLLMFQRMREAGWRAADAAAGVSERTAYTWLKLLSRQRRGRAARR